MVEHIEGLDAAVLAFRLSGKVTREEYDTYLLPPLKAALEGGGPLRYLLQVGPDFDELSGGAVWEDAKEGLAALKSYPRWERVAAVTDVEWIERAISLFGWLAPGEVKTFGLDELEVAKAWVSA